MIKILWSAVVAFLAVLLVEYWFPVSAQSEPTQVEVIVSQDMKGAPGVTRLVPIELDVEAEFTADIVEFYVTWNPRVLILRGYQFGEIAHLVYAQDIYILENLRVGEAYMRFTFDGPRLFEAGRKTLIAVEFEVIGEKGAVGVIGIKDFSFGEADVEILVQNAKFHVLPTALYYNNQGYVEITSSEVFTTFEMVLAGELNLSANNDSMWIFEQIDDRIIGRAPDPDQGVTTVPVPVSSVNSENVVIYSLKLNNDEKVQYVEQPEPEPVQLKLFVPLLNNN